MSLLTRQILFVFVQLFTLSAAVACVVYGTKVIWRWRERQKYPGMALKLVVSMAALVGGTLSYTACLYSMLPRPPSSSELANRPGTLTKVGQPAPDFHVTTLSGDAFELKAQRGKVLVVNFFATWCGPCLQELPRLEADVWQRFRSNQSFAMLVVGREESDTALKSFCQKQGITFPVAADPDRTIYSRFASERIPRTYIITPEGTIAWQTTGYTAGEFRNFLKALEQELKKAQGR